MGWVDGLGRGEEDGLNEVLWSLWAGGWVGYLGFDDEVSDDAVGSPGPLAPPYGLAPGEEGGWVGGWGG